MRILQSQRCLSSGRYLRRKYCLGPQTKPLQFCSRWPTDLNHAQAAATCSRAHAAPAPQALVLDVTPQSMSWRHYTYYQRVQQLHWQWLCAAAALLAAAQQTNNDSGDHGTGTASCAFERRIEDMYELVDKPVGHGAFGIVVAGIHRETREVVAIKRVPLDSMSWSRVKAEVDILQIAGQHKHVASYRDFFADRKAWYIVMEFAQGGELFDRLVHKGAYNEQQAAAFVKQVVDALSFLHFHGITHFDLKPENIMLASSSDDEVNIRIVDFGSAQRLGQDVKGDPRENSGTVAYSAPEVLKGLPFDNKADMWSLGILLYILLSGMHPFDLVGDADDEAVRKRVLEGKITFPEDVWAGVSDQAVQLIRKLLAADPEARPSAKEVLESSWLSGIMALSDRPLSHTRENLRVFHEGRLRLKATLLAVMSGLADREFYKRHKGTVGSRRLALDFMDHGKGYITASDLQSVLRQLGEDLSSDEVQQMMRSADGDPKTHSVEKIDRKHMLNLVPPLCPSRVFKEGEVIYSKGDVDTNGNFFLVDKGQVEVAVPARRPPGPAPPKQGRKRPVQMEPPQLLPIEALTRGQHFGEAELVHAAGILGRDRVLPPAPRATTCTCRSARCEIVAVPRDLFSHLTDEFPGLRRRLKEQAGASLLRTLDAVLTSGLVPARTREFENPGVVWNGTEARKAASKGPARGTLFVVREGALDVTLTNGDKMRLKPGACCLCGTAVDKRMVAQVECVSGTKITEVSVEALYASGAVGRPTLQMLVHLLQSE